MSVWPAGVDRSIGPLPASLGAALRASAARRGEALAIAFYGAEISFAELLRRVERLSAFLQHRCGVAQGDRVLLDMQNSPHAIIAYQAIARAGGVVVPVNPMSMPDEIAYLAADSGATVALIGAELAGRFTALVPAPLGHVVVAAYGDEVPADTPFRLPPVIGESVLPDRLPPAFIAWGEALAETRPPRPDISRPDDLCVMPYTSGTTGKPKACMHTHHSVLFTAFVQARWYFYDDDTVLTGFMPMFHVAGMQLSLNGCAACGASVVVMARWDRDLVAPLFRRYGVTLWSAAPTMVVDALAAEGFDDAAFARLKIITGGGAAMPAAVAAELKRCWNLAYVEGYGLTETMSPSHLNPVDRPKPQCLGVPVQETDARIIDPATLMELPQGETGEIVVSGPQVMRGYWQRPEETVLAIDPDGFLLTGDIGYVDADGFLFLIDRKKDTIMVSGFNVYPGEIETVLLLHPGIREAAAIGIADEKSGEVVKAFVVRRDPQLSADEIIHHCRAHLTAYKVPKQVEFRDELPHTNLGKVMRRALRDTPAAGPT